MYADQEAQKPVDTTGRAILNERAGAVSTQGRMNEAIKHGYVGRDVDDEERFLYGDDAAEQNTRPPDKPKEEPPQSESKDTTVTPGGFDSNALKNVLKAIGFDFEMSAQQIQSSMGKSLAKNVETTPTPKKVVAETKVKPKPPLKSALKPTPKATVKPEMPQKIQTIQKIQTLQSGHAVKAKAAENQAQQSQQYFQTYDPYNPIPNPQYNPQPIQATQQVQPVVYQNPAPTSLGYPVAIPDPNNPGGTLLVYQPINQPAASQQPVYHQPEQSASQTLGHGGRIVLPPQRESEAKIAPEPEKDERQERLNYLQDELEKLKKQQNVLMEKKRKDSTPSAGDRSQVRIYDPFVFNDSFLNNHSES